MILEIILALIFLTLGCIHFYWAFGGQWGVNATFPILDNKPKGFKPPFSATIIVGLGLCAMGIFYFMRIWPIEISIIEVASKYIQWIIPSIFALRAIGDFKYVGFFKSRKSSKFAIMDTKLFSPLCVLLALLGYSSNFL